MTMMHLATKGYQRIGFVSTSIHGNDRLQQRKIGYRNVLNDLGVKDCASMGVEAPLTAQGGAEALIQLTRRHKEINAIFFSSDTLAVSVIQECHRRQWKVLGGRCSGASSLPVMATWSLPQSLIRH